MNGGQPLQWPPDLLGLYRMDKYLSMSKNRCREEKKHQSAPAFGLKDHRSYNRDGAAFDKGETFSGVPYELGLEAVEALKKVFGTGDLEPIAIRWILRQSLILQTGRAFAIMLRCA